MKSRLSYSVLLSGIVALCLTAPAFAGGASEVGNGRMVPAAPRAPEQGNQKGGQRKPGPDGKLPQTTELVAATFDAEKFSAGEELSATVELRAEPIAGCKASFASHELAAPVRFTDCSVVKAEGVSQQLKLKYTLSSRSVARAYRLQALEIIFEDGTTAGLQLGAAEGAIKQARVDSKEAPSELKLTSAIVRTASGSTEVRRGEVFTLELELGSETLPLDGELQVRSVMTTPQGVEYVRIPARSGYTAIAADGRLVVAIELVVPERYSETTGLVFERLLIINEALQQLDAKLPDALGVSVFKRDSAG